MGCGLGDEVAEVFAPAVVAAVAGGGEPADAAAAGEAPAGAVAGDPAAPTFGEAEEAGDGWAAPAGALFFSSRLRGYFSIFCA